MRIVNACRVYATNKPNPGGMIQVAVHRCAELAARGHDVHILTAGGEPAAVELDGTTVHHLPCKPLVYSAEYFAACRDACDRLQPDIIHSDGIGDAWWDGLAGGATVGVTNHGNIMELWLGCWYRHRLGAPNMLPFPADAIRRRADEYGRIDAVFATNRFELWELRDVFGCTNAKLLYNPLPAYFFGGVTSPPPGGYFMAVKDSPSEGTPQARVAADRAGVEFRVVRGYAHSEMPGVYDAARALCSPTMRANGFDMIVAEATARRRPSIVSGIAAYYREAEDRPWIVTVPLGDVEALAGAMAGDLPDVPEGAADRYRVAAHVDTWLEGLA